MGYSTLTRPVDSSIRLIFSFYLATSIVGKLKRQHRCLGQSSGRSLMVDRFFSCVCFDSNVLVVLVDFLGARYVKILYLKNEIPDFGSFNDHLESGGTQLLVS